MAGVAAVGPRCEKAGKILLLKTEVTKAQLRQQRDRCNRFAAQTAEAIGAARQCLFSLLPYDERRRQAASWYDACAQAMLRGNYAPLDEWIRCQARTAAEERFELEDLLQLLRLCRRSAIEIDGWDEDVFSAVDDVINEGLIASGPSVSWNMPGNLNYLKTGGGAPVSQTEPETTPTNAPAGSREGERRGCGRNRLALPIRVRYVGEQSHMDEVTHTENVSLRGLCFKTQLNYQAGASLRIVYPYWTDPGSINREYSARVTRLDPLPGRSWAVAVKFLQNLREQTK